jgi:hypothetical protein
MSLDKLSLDPTAVEVMARCQVLDLNPKNKKQEDFFLLFLLPSIKELDLIHWQVLVCPLYQLT